jgi:hypothetical protein
MRQSIFIIEMSISTTNRTTLFDWLRSVTDEIICEQYRSSFFDCSSQFLNRCLYKKTLCQRTYQIYALGSMYISSCFNARYPISLEDLCDLCDHCYTRGEVIDVIYDIINVICYRNEDIDMSPPPTTIRRLCKRVESECSLVQCTNGKLYVCKTIYHTKDHMPHYSAMVEVCTSIVIGRDVEHICKLETVGITSKACRLYYKYYPDPFKAFRVHNKSSLSNYILQLAKGIRVLHSRDVAHRDLKPDNIQLLEDGTLFIIDFGSCGYGKERFTVPICTMTHRSPEVLHHEINATSMTYDGKALDMWSLGVLLAELVLQKHVFGTIYEDTTPVEVMSMITTGLPLLPQELIHVNASIVKIILGCLQLEPTKRWTINNVLSEIRRKTFGK